MAALEDDLWVFRHRDLRDLWIPKSGMTVRWVISAIQQLLKQEKSLLRRHLLGDQAEWGGQQHLTADVRDLLLQVAYFSMVNCQSNLKRSQWDQVVRDMPTAPLRPGDEPRELEFADKDELIMLFGNGKPRGRRA